MKSNPIKIQESLEQRTMNYVCIRWKSYKDVDFDERENIREELRLALESHGIRFLEYSWIWDENDRCLLMVGSYKRIEDARQWIRVLESMGFEIIVRASLPGENHDCALEC
jgi:hypothetical protein